MENDQVLRKNDNIHFKLKDSSEWKTATLISCKATRKYKKAWNSKLDDWTMQSIDYEKDVCLEYLPKPSASNPTNPQTNTKEVLCSKIYLTELENQTMEASWQNWKTGRNKRFIERKKTWDNRASQLGESSAEKLKMEKISPKQDFVQGVLRRSKTSPPTPYVSQELVFTKSLFWLPQTVGDKINWC